ncbi:MAG: nucleotidyl transferase AbiEii/AbiGii toxin family protein [Waterburya sp.]
MQKLIENTWWVKDPKNLPEREKLAIYEDNWDLLNNLEQEELFQVQKLAKKYNSFLFCEMKKEVFYGFVDQIVKTLNKDLLNTSEALLAGDTLLGLRLKPYRYSTDLDFHISLLNFYKLKNELVKGNHISLANNSIVFEEIKNDRYGLRYKVLSQENPLLGRVAHGGNPQDRARPQCTVKLEIVVSDILPLNDWDKTEEGLNCLTWKAMTMAKLFANADRFLVGSLSTETAKTAPDRFLDYRVFSRDLIDLAVMAKFNCFSISALKEAEEIYFCTTSRLREVIARFENDEKLQQKCFEQLQITEVELVFDGLNQLKLLIEQIA